MDPKERRRHILTKAAELFGDNGYHATSISQIIEAAGIARGTFYLYFDNKRALFDELLDDMLQGIASRIRTVEISTGGPSARDQIMQNLKNVIELLKENRAFLSILLEGAVGLDKGFADKLADFYEGAAKIVRASLDLGQKMELVRPCNTHIAALAVIGGLKEILHDILRHDGGRIADIEALASEVLDLFTRGVLAKGVSIP